MTVDQDVMFTDDGNYLYAHKGRLTIRLCDCRAIPPEYLKLLEASGVMLRFVKDTRSSLANLLQYLEANRIDTTTPALVWLISAADIVQEVVVDGTEKVATKFNKNRKNSG